MKNTVRFTALLLTLLLSVPAAAAPTEFSVGKEISVEDIIDFYYTYDASTDPPHYQRYRFYTEDGRYYFFHETRQGDSWPQTEEDITASGTAELTDEEWTVFCDLLRGGSVKARCEEDVDGDPGPWLYLYWTGDEGEYQEYSFHSYSDRNAFETFCSVLAGKHVLTRLYFTRGGYTVPQTYEVRLENGRYTISENGGEPIPLDTEPAGELLDAVSDYGLESWDGFHKSDPYVLDGEGFLLEMDFADGVSISASGDNSFPDGYFAVSSALDDIFEREKTAHLAGTYFYEDEGFSSGLAITLNENGTYYISSKDENDCPGGSWYVDYDFVILNEEDGYGPAFMFRYGDGALSFYEAGSDEFPYLNIADGDIFIRQCVDEGDD